MAPSYQRLADLQLDEKQLLRLQRRCAIRAPLLKEKPSEAQLKELHRALFDALPFENLSVLEDEIVSLDLADIIDKMCGPDGESRRGGYCFELNKLLAALLLHLGYEVQPLAARVWLDDGSTLRQPTWPLQTHLCLIASVDTKSFLCDVGFGKLGLSEPLPLELLDQESVVNGHCRVKLLSSQRKTVQGLEYSVYTLWHDGPSGTAWIRGYSFLPAQDFDLLDTLPLNTHVFGHYESNFTQSLWFEKRNGTEHARILGKTFLRNGKETPITSATQIQQLLLQHFDLRLPLQLCQRIQGLGQLDTPQKRWGGVLATRALKAAPRVRSGARAAALRPLLAGLLAVLAVCFWLRPLLPHGVLTMSEDSEFAWGQGT